MTKDLSRGEILCFDEPGELPQRATGPSERGAVLSDDGRYRYRLWRIWDDLAPVMVWVLLNPSTADAEQDDPTVRKCIGFAKAHDHGGIIIVNLFAWRATNPKELIGRNDPIGPENDAHIAWAVSAPILATVVGGWGRIVSWQLQRREVAVSVNIRARRKLHCFGQNANGSPKHPLYLPYTQPLELLK